MFKIKKKVVLISLSLMFIGLIILPFSTAAAEKTVAVTIVPQIEMIRAIAGNRVKVVEMIPKGFSPSNYAPSPAEMRAFNEASIYFAMGVPADMQNILPRAEEISDLKVVKLFEEIEAEHPHRYFGTETAAAENEIVSTDQKRAADLQESNEHAHSHQGGRDPHIWLSPSRVETMVEIMRDQLIELLPQHEEEFIANTEDYLDQLAAADRKNKELLAPYKGEEILVYHPSFGYFTDHYGLKMLAIEEDGKDPGPRHLQQIIENAAKKGVKNVFYQAEIDSRKTKAVAEELGGEIVQLNPLAENYIQNLKVMAEKMEEELAKRDDQ